MRQISKCREPDSLLEYRLQVGAVYDGPLFTTVKKDVREYLLREQGHLCAYCMQRIYVSTMKIEHWRCQDAYPPEQLSYRNMLGVCPGNEGLPPANQTCDTRKGNKDLSYNPADPAHHPRLRIRYDATGKIFSLDDAFNAQLNEVLNLNWTRLKENRKGVWDAVTTILGKTHGVCTRSQLIELIGKWNAHNPGELMKEYNDVATYYLNKKLVKVN